MDYVQFTEEVLQDILFKLLSDIAQTVNYNTYGQ